MLIDILSIIIQYAELPVDNSTIPSLHLDAQGQFVAHQQQRLCIHLRENLKSIVNYFINPIIDIIE